MIRWDPQTGETFKGPTKDGPWTPISREEFDIRLEHRKNPLPLKWEPPSRECDRYREELQEAT